MAIMPKTTWSDVANRLEAYLAGIITWMSANMLKLNEKKTQLIIFNPKHQVRMNKELRLQVGNNTVASLVNNLGVYVDTSPTMERQVNAISKPVITKFVISVISGGTSHWMFATHWHTPG
jgi:hypothetical protein